MVRRLRGAGGDPVTVVSRSEAGLRGYQSTLAKYGAVQLNKWRRTGGRRPNPTLLEIREMEREQAATKASARRERRSSSSGGS